MAGSVASAAQKIRFVRETLTGSINYTCGEAPLLPWAALRLVDLAFFRWVKRLLGMGARASIARGVAVKKAKHGGFGLTLPSAQCMSTAVDKLIRHLHESTPYGAILRDSMGWTCLAWAILQELWPGALPREESCGSRILRYIHHLGVKLGIPSTWCEAMNKITRQPLIQWAKGIARRPPKEVVLNALLVLGGGGCPAEPFQNIRNDRRIQFFLPRPVLGRN